MRVIDLTNPQKTQAATNKTAVETARAALSVAIRTAEEYLRTAAAAQAKEKVQLSDDGASVVIG